MKKSITGVVALLAGAFVAHSQGTVSFANYNNGSGSYSYVSLAGGAKLGGATGATSSTAVADNGNGNFWTAAVYGGAGTGDAASSLVALNQANGTPATATFADNSAGNPGEWYGSEIAVVPGTQSGTGGLGLPNSATIQVYAWYNAGGTINSYNAAVAAGVPAGFSSTANILNLGGQPASGPANFAPSITGAAGVGNFTVSSSVPEPSTIALGVMGASAFLMRLRKKQ
jgi:hypothetical protein